MTSNRKQPVVSSQDYLGTSTIENLPNAILPQSPTTLAQQNEALALKQDKLTPSSGTEITDNVIKVALATAGSDYNSLQVSGTGYTSLDGSYTRLNYNAYLEHAGTNLDLLYGGDFSTYYKDNGGGVWSFIAKREQDGVEDGDDSFEYWLCCLVTTDPTTVTTTVTSFIPNYQAVDYKNLTNSNELDGTNFVPASGVFLGTDVVYAAGSTPAGLLFDNGKLAIDFAQSISESASTKVFPASVVKTYIDEQVSSAKDSSNNTFSNTAAQITGNPSNVQSLGEALAGEIDTLDNRVSNTETINSSQGTNILAHSSALGIANGGTNMGEFTSLHAPDNSDLKTVIESVCNEIDTVNGELHDKLGVAEGVSGLGLLDTTVITDNSNVKQAIEQLGSATQLLQSGSGAFWSAATYHHHADISALPAGWGDGSTDVGAFVVDETGSNMAISAMNTGDTILVIDGGVESGKYVVNANQSTSRSVDADSDEEFTTNKTIVIANGGSHAGATYAYTGPDNPAVGTDVITFEFKAPSVTGDYTITETKLVTALASKINDKTNKYVETVTTDAQGFAVVTHNLGTEDFIAQARSTTAVGETLPSIEFSDFTSTTVKVGGQLNTSYKVTLVG